MTTIDWFAVLKAKLETDSPASTMSSEEIDALVADILADRIATPDPRRSHRARRRWIAAGAAIGVMAGGATVAALLNRAKPDNPHEGIACHASADLAAGAVILPPAADPLAACAQLWLAGALPDIEHGGRAIDIAPPLFACVGLGGGFDVFPSQSDPASTCIELGVVAAITEVGTDPLVVLQDRLTNDINLACVDLDRARQLAQTALTDLGLADWTVTVRDGTVDCVKAGQDPDSRSIYLQSLPN